MEAITGYEALGYALVAVYDATLAYAGRGAEPVYIGDTLTVDPVCMV